MNNTPQYTIWLMPQGELYEELAGIISVLSTEYASPLFEPHITLLGDIAEPEEHVMSKTAELANSLKPFSTSLTTLDSLDEYFRCVFVRAKETQELMEASRKARELFGRQQDPPFMPHLSLLYGNFSKEAKEHIVAQIGREFARTFEVSSLFLTNSSKSTNLKDWKALKEFPL